MQSLELRRKDSEFTFNDAPMLEDFMKPMKSFEADNVRRYFLVGMVFRFTFLNINLFFFEKLLGK